MREGIMTNRWTTSATLVAFLIVQAGIAHADLAADRCGASKMKAAGKYGQSVLKCHATATKRNEATDPVCLSKATGKLTTAFDNAEDVSGCVTSDDEGSVSSSLSNDIDAILLSLAPEANDEARACASSKMKAAGKQIGTILKCYATGAKNSEAPDSECIAKGYTKLVGAFSKAEGRGGCTTTGDVGTIDMADENASEEQVEALSPVCGDAIVGPTQQCEVGNDPGCPGLCSASCACVFPPDCGDGSADLPEECDDGANVDGDGCSATCQLEDASALCAGVPATSGTDIDAVLVSDQFNEPTHAVAPPLDPARLFVVERSGLIRILNLDDNSIEPVDFLDIEDIVDPAGEGGLLSMAFDPDYDTNRRFFVYYTNNSGDIVIARYQTDSMNAGIADESTAHILLTVPHPFNSNHNGGQLAFGADGYLYAGTGDGGGGDDPNENAQNDASLLGKMLRIDIDVDVPPYYAVPADNPFVMSLAGDFRLIWAKGLRNPWRFSFDLATGDQIIGDVGQGTREEIDFESASSPGGTNWGWDIFEGTTCHEPVPPAMSCPMPPTGFTFPIFEYNHGVGCSITGGFVYRGCAMPDMESQYFYSDYCAGFIRTVEISGGTAINPTDRTADVESAGASISNVVSFGQDARGEIYIINQGGQLYRIEPE
jgi:cysteine-rich repeat protein